MAAHTQESLVELAKTDLTAFIGAFVAAQEAESDELDDEDDDRGDSYSHLAYFLDQDLDEDLPVLGIKIENVYSTGGNEGGGEQVVRVYKVTAGSEAICYFQATGYYISHDGTTWDGDFSYIYPRVVQMERYFTEEGGTEDIEGYTFE